MTASCFLTAFACKAEISAKRPGQVNGFQSLVFLHFDTKVYFSKLDDFKSGIFFILAAPAYDEEELDDPFTAEGDNFQPCLEYFTITYHFLPV